MAHAKEWREIRRQAKRLKAIPLAKMLFQDPKRVKQLTYTLDDLTLDLSKEKLDADAMNALLALARAAKVERWRDRMAAGAKINESEGRAVLHMALRGSVRAPKGDDVDGELQRFLEFAGAVRGGEIKGKGGGYEDVVNIGIGGSDLGPRMAMAALKPVGGGGVGVHFVSNLDSVEMIGTLAGLDPERTLVIVSSKTFTTLETLSNAKLAAEWLGPLAKTQMVAVSASPDKCVEYGISEDRVYRYWNWVGGRYSIWSAVGLPLAIGIGAGKYREFLEGAAAMDRHFLEAPLEENLPVLYAMAGIWRRNAMGWPAVALIPYDHLLEKLPAYVQQLDMESNGKSATRTGKDAGVATGPTIWGAAGTNAQHSFFQHLHQGTDTVPVDFILAARTQGGDRQCHDRLRNNCLAQGMALALGRNEAETLRGDGGDKVDEKTQRRLAAGATMPGDRPSTTLLHRQLDPYSLGRLVALFEHKVFVQGIVWGLNSFDQPGVSLGKAIALSLDGESGETEVPVDHSTKALQARLRELEK